MEQRCCSNSNHLKFPNQELASWDKTMQNFTWNWTERNTCLSPRRCSFITLFITFQMHWFTTAGKTSLESAHEVQYSKHGAAYPRWVLALPPSNFHLSETSFSPAAAWRWREHPFPLPDVIESVVGHLVMHLVVERRRDVARRLAPKVRDQLGLRLRPRLRLWLRPRLRLGREPGWCWCWNHWLLLQQWACSGTWCGRWGSWSHNGSDWLGAGDGQGKGHVGAQLPAPL